MIPTQPISLLNTGLAVFLLVALAIVLPRMLLPAGNLSQQALALSVAISAVLLVVSGTVLIAMAYAGAGLAVWAAFLDAKAAITAFFLRLSANMVIVWGPVLALTWLSMAQGVERRKGEAQAKRDAP